MFGSREILEARKISKNGDESPHWTFIDMALDP
jgi:hypothetical protein